MRPSRYEPDRGDLITLDFDPQAGHEQAGRRPALIVSPRLFNVRVGLAWVCPITSRVRGRGFEVRLPEATDIAGVILVDQLRSADWRARSARFVERAPEDILCDVLGKIAAVLEL